MYEYGIETFVLKHAKSYLLGIHAVFEMLTNNANLGREASEFIVLLKRFSYKSHYFLCSYRYWYSDCSCVQSKYEL
ncbi:MAG: toxin ParE1/3/4 [Polaribacter sp.]|jgi:toxin ParE1/3/4